MKKIMLFLFVFAFTIQAVESAKLCRTNWPYMGNNCILEHNGYIYVGLKLESESNKHLNSGLSVIFNNSSIPLSDFIVGRQNQNGVYTYSYIWVMPFENIPNPNEFEYEISYSSEAEFTQLFIPYSQSSHTNVIKTICSTPGNPLRLANDVKPSKFKDELTIHPNPFNEFLSIEYLVDNENLTNIDIADLTGKIWISYNKQSDSFNANKYINTSLLKPGIYFCRIYNNEQTIIRKIIKAK